MPLKFLIVGAGFSGAVLARSLAEELSCDIVVIDSRDHAGGNCHTVRDPATGIMLHRYGPHIFNTNDQRVWDYVNSFGTLVPHVNRVKAVTPRGLFALPLNLLTINQFFGKTFNPREARAFVASLGDSAIEHPRNFEEQALHMVGRELYENFFLGYTIKQWGCHPRELPASVLKRLPIRFNYDDNYYDKALQGIPRDGFTAIIERILDHPRIALETSRPFDPGDIGRFDHTFYTGPLDEFFNFRHGRLGYRTVTFDRIDAEGDYQGNAVINYTDASVPFTRIHEHKHFAPWEKHERTVAFREFSKETAPGDTPYYPKRLAADHALLARYRAEAEEQNAVSFLGRLATYRYMDMERVIAEALDYAAVVVAGCKAGESWPRFPNRE